MPHSRSVNPFDRSRFFTDKTGAETAKTHRPSAFESRFLQPEMVIDIVCEITGVRKSEIAQSAMGPRANPARRFAVWALRTHTRLKNREIGRAIKMTYNQVSNVLSRFQSGEEPIRSWVAELSSYVTRDGVCKSSRSRLEGVVRFAYENQPANPTRRLR